MPMKWTPENEKVLLLTLIKTHNITVNYDLIAQNWPNPNEKPTKKAISEKFYGMRKSMGVVNSAPHTPKKKEAAVPKTLKKGTPKAASGTKRKRNVAVKEDESDTDVSLGSDSEPVLSPTPKRAKKTTINPENKSDSEEDARLLGLAARRVRIPRAAAQKAEKNLKEAELSDNTSDTISAPVVQADEKENVLENAGVGEEALEKRMRSPTATTT